MIILSLNQITAMAWAPAFEGSLKSTPVRINLVSCWTVRVQLFNDLVCNFTQQDDTLPYYEAYHRFANMLKSSKLKVYSIAKYVMSGAKKV